MSPSQKKAHLDLIDAVECPCRPVADYRLFCFVFFPQDIDIKKVNGVPQYAFLQYCDIASVCKAIKKMDGEYLGNNRLKVKKSSRRLYRRVLCSSGVYGSKMFFNE